MVEKVKSTDLIAYRLDVFPHHDLLSSFSCGKETYDKYLREEAISDHENSVGAVWIFYHRKDDALAGYVTMAMSQIHKTDSDMLRDLTFHSYIPGLLLGQMARDLKYKKRGVGDLMINWVVSQAQQLRQKVGCRLIILQSEDDKVKDYERFGFILIPPSRRKKNMMFYDLNWF